MSDFKAQAVKFRASVEKMSKDILESIDQSEVYNLINEDKYDEGDSYNQSFKRADGWCKSVTKIIMYHSGVAFELSRR